MSKFYTFQKTEDISVSPENPDEASSANAQQGWIPKLLGRLMDRLSEQKGVGWNEDTPITALAAKQAIDANRALGYKPDVRATTTANLTTLVGAQTIDTVAVVAGDRVLVKNQTTPSQNGIYVVAAGAWTRAGDLDDAGDFIYGVTVRVREGSTQNAGQFYYLSSTRTVVMESTGIVFTVQPGAPAAVADASASQKGATLLSVNPASSTSPIALGVNDTSFSTTIEGLQLVYDGANALSATSGRAWIQASGKVVEVASAISKTSISLTANTMYYVYLFLNSGTPDILISTTAPDVPYRGSARSLPSNTTHRYIGSFRSHPTLTQIMPFLRVGTEFMYMSHQTNMRALADGRNTTTTNVGLGSFVPVTARAVYLSWFWDRTNQVLRIGTPAMGTLSASNFLIESWVFASADGNASQYFNWWVPLESSLNVSYYCTAAPTATHGWQPCVMAFREER